MAHPKLEEARDRPVRMEFAETTRLELSPVR